MSDKKAEFIALFRQTGWSQAELARKLDMTRGGVNGIVTGSDVPSPILLKLLKLVVATDDSVTIEPLKLADEPSVMFTPEEIKLIHELRLLPESDRAAHLKIFKQMLAAAPKKTTAYKTSKRL